MESANKKVSKVLKLDERKKKVLAAIVQDYILTAEPVGSRTIARKYDLGVSPATIRNEMADLEELGLIEQPHTSAGRVPSDFGYRYYVDWLMSKKELTPGEESYIGNRFKKKMKDLEDIVMQATAILSEMSSFTALALGPCLRRSVFGHIQLLGLEPGKALLVVVTKSRLVEHRIIEIPPDVTNEDLKRISVLLNSRLKGLAWEQIKKLTLDDIYLEYFRHREIFSAIISLLEEALNSEEERVYLEGRANISKQPEFKDVERFRGVLSILERKDVIRQLLRDAPATGLTIRIGRENKYEGLEECSIITATYHVYGEIVGSVGILGPRRMDYGRMVSLVEGVTKHLSISLANLLG